MAEAFKILDQWGRIYGASNTLFDAARTDRGRPAAPRVDRDTRQNISQFGYRELMAAGRFIYANCPPLANAINKQADLAIGNAFFPQYYGANKAWGQQAEALLNQWHKILDVRGGVYDWTTNLKLWLKSIKRDGDVGILFTEGAGGYPLIQTIPAHRIGGWYVEPFQVNDGPWAGYDLRWGVISNDVARAVAYRVYGANGITWRDISAVNTLDEDGELDQTADMLLIFDPDWADQGRGLAKLASGLNDWSDIKQVKEFIKLALKKESSFAVVEYNETGTADTATDFARVGIGDQSTGAAIYSEKTEGGLTQIYKANSGSKVEFPAGERPSERSQEFWLKIQRDAFQSIGWPMEFYDSMSKGGAAIRLIMELAAPTIANDQAIAQKIATRIDAWRLAKAIKRGELPFDPDWWKIRHTPPEEMTADKGYSAKINQDLYKIGAMTFREWCAKNGKREEDVMRENEAHIIDLATRADRISQQIPSLTFEMALNLLEQRSPNIPSAPAVKETEDATEPPQDQNKDTP